VDFDKETEEVEPNLDPTKSPVGYAVAMNLFRLNVRIGGVQDYIKKLKLAMKSIDKELWPKDEFQSELDLVMARLEDVPERVQAWK
jgi:hypothetical protein